MYCFKIDQQGNTRLNKCISAAFRGHYKEFNWFIQRFNYWGQD